MMDTQQKSLEDRSLEIRQRLEELNEEINGAFDKKMIEKIATPEIKRKVRNFAESEMIKLDDEIKQAIKVLNSPIFVGLLGRYSHGKTALLNALFELKEDFALPEGKSIVTSKVTRVEFDDNVTAPACYECLIDKSKKAIDISELKLNVSGKVTQDDTSIDYYKMTMPTRGRPFANIFASQMINLIDMPGLGGLYARDTARTRQYIENLDLLLVVIRLLDIDGAGQTLEPYISGNRIPTIPVLTFLDEWRSKEDNKFMECNSYEDVIVKARKSLQEAMPSLTDKHLMDLVAVSSTKKEKIADLREIIKDFVIFRELAIEKIRKEKPEIYRRKIADISKQIQKLIARADSSISMLEKNIVSMLPDTGNFVSFQKYFARNRERYLRDAKRDIKGLAREAFEDVSGKVSDIRHRRSRADIDKFVSDIKDSVNSKALKQFKDQVAEKFDDIKEKIQSEVEKYINKMELSATDKREKKDEISRIVNDRTIDLKSISYTPPETVTETLKAGVKIGFELILGQMKNPQTLIPLFLGILLIVFGSRIPWVGEYAGYLGWILTIGSLLYFLLLEPTSIVKRELENSKTAIIDSLKGSFAETKEKIERDASDSMEAAVSDLLIEIEEELPIDDYEKDLKTVRSAERDLKAKVEELNKYLVDEMVKLEIDR